MWRIVAAVLSVQAYLFVGTTVYLYVWRKRYDQLYAMKGRGYETTCSNRAGDRAMLVAVFWLPLLIGVGPAWIVWYGPYRLGALTYRKIEAYKKARATKGKLDPELARQALGLDAEVSARTPDQVAREVLLKLRREAGE